MESLLTPLTTFKDQFNFNPSIVHEEYLGHFDNVVITGMGGSAICVSLLKILFPELSVTLHNSYGLPANYNKATTLLILNSYSGNTEETLDAFERGHKEGATMAILSRGGILIQKGKDLAIPYIELPESNLEPRFSIGHQLIGLLTLMQESDKICILREKVALVQIDKADTLGKELSHKLTNTYPVIYSGSAFYPVAYLIKAAINEGAKVPSFVNQIPEANHNELQSFITDDTRNEHERFSFLFISSHYDHIRVAKRFSVMKDLYTSSGFTVTNIHKDSTNITDIFEVILTGYYLSTYLAIAKNIDPYKTPFIQEFKKIMAQ